MTGPFSFAAVLGPMKLSEGGGLRISRGNPVRLASTARPSSNSQGPRVVSPALANRSHGRLTFLVTFRCFPNSFHSFSLIKPDIYSRQQHRAAGVPYEALTTRSLSLGVLAHHGSKGYVLPLVGHELDAALYRERDRKRSR